MSAISCPDVKPFTDPRMDEILLTIGDAISRKMGADGLVGKTVAWLMAIIETISLINTISVLLDEISEWFDEAKENGEKIMQHECCNCKHNHQFRAEIKAAFASLYSIIDSTREKIIELQSKLSKSSIPPYKIMRRIDVLLEDMNHLCLNLSIAQDDELQELAEQAQAVLKAMP
ncbi:MAG: hypothetical protein HQL95_14780 [Magnetococcales bacterium]|nr:hypothetical protein [Magnetococcales bacterium]